jgi:hypothetical protein
MSIELERERARARERAREGESARKRERERESCVESADVEESVRPSPHTHCPSPQTAAGANYDAGSVKG